MDRRPHGTVHLVRHLATDGTPAGRLDRHGLREWLAREDGCGIRADAGPSADLVELVAASRYLLVSPLDRAQATADAVLRELGAPVAGAPPPEVRTVEALREVPLPVLPVSRVRLPLGGWDLACCAAWLCACAGRVESPSRAVVRPRGSPARSSGSPWPGP